MRRILVLRGGALGDFLVTLPALFSLRQRWPSAEIELVGNAVAAELARARHLIERVHSQHEARWSALYGSQPLPDELGKWLGTFDAVINYWPDPDGDLARHLPIHAAQRFITWPAMPTRGPAAAHYVEGLRPLGIQCGPTFCRLEPDRVTLPSKAELHVGPMHGPVAIHPGSGSPRKNWPATRWLEVIAAIPSPVLVVLGAAEAASWDARQLAGTALGPRLRDGTLRLAANLPLEDLVRLLSECRLFLGHDSGVSHLAAACGVPSILLFGPTDPAVWAPPAPHVQVLRRGDDLASITVADVLTATTAADALSPIA